MFNNFQPNRSTLLLLSIYSNYKSSQLATQVRCSCYLFVCYVDNFELLLVPQKLFHMWHTCAPWSRCAALSGSPERSSGWTSFRTVCNGNPSVHDESFHGWISCGRFWTFCHNPLPCRQSSFLQCVLPCATSGHIYLGTPFHILRTCLYCRCYACCSCDSARTVLCRSCVRIGHTCSSWFLCVASCAI